MYACWRIVQTGNINLTILEFEDVVQHCAIYTAPAPAAAAAAGTIESESSSSIE